MYRGTFRGHRSIIKPDGSTPESWHRFNCGYCGASVSGAVVATFPQDAGSVKWLQCTDCASGSVLDQEGIVRPLARFGPYISGLPDDIERAYSEARDCISVNALTACELVCRKVLMHIAVEKGASEGASFASYVTHLEKQGFVTPPMKDWVDQIRSIGNAATHELTPPDRRRAESTLMFTAELLRLVYEMAALTEKYAPAAATD